MTLTLDRIRKLRECIKVSGPYEAAVRLDEQSGELDAALAAAEALARLRKLLGSVDAVRIAEYDVGDKRGVSVDWRVGGALSKGAWGPTLLTALTGALDQAEAGT